MQITWSSFPLLQNSRFEIVPPQEKAQVMAWGLNLGLQHACSLNGASPMWNLEVRKCPPGDVVQYRGYPDISFELLLRKVGSPHADNVQLSHFRNRFLRNC
ncbi:hypothetical protein TNCV_4359271 [Trichonephila clavipes]|uniref:Uncharacterized protein n=1 Tax=Trichonephila clavipes TaxID=2585209 RepID=A0A8X7BH19_TRICX|nr:hypothetical protein TNCV_4359271 [Trichonephila clavipes]